MSHTCSDSRARVRLIRKTPPLFLFLIVFILQPVFPAFSSQVVIDEIKIIPNGESTTFNINFGLPLAYQKHFPRNIGEIVQIQLKLEEEEKGREIHKEVRDSGELLTPEGVKSDLVYVT